MIEFKVRSRWTGGLKFAAEIDCDEDAGRGLKVGLAVKWALEKGVDLGGANLSHADLEGVNLIGASLPGADLSDACLRGTILRGADLRKVNLNCASLGYANLREANLNCADMRGSSLTGANLEGANLGYANLGGALLSNANLSGVKCWGTIGNMFEVKSAQLGTWPITYWQSEGEEITLQIGCKKFPLSQWEEADDIFIRLLAAEALPWWRKHRDLVLTMVKTCPPVSSGSGEFAW